MIGDLELLKKTMENNNIDINYILLIPPDYTQDKIKDIKKEYYLDDGYFECYTQTLLEYSNDLDSKEISKYLIERIQK